MQTGKIVYLGLDDILSQSIMKDVSDLSITDFDINLQLLQEADMVIYHDGTHGKIFKDRKWLLKPIENINSLHSIELELFPKPDVKNINDRVMPKEQYDKLIMDLKDKINSCRALIEIDHKDKMDYSIVSLADTRGVIREINLDESKIKIDLFDPNRLDNKPDKDFIEYVKLNPEKFGIGLRYTGTVNPDNTVNVEKYIGANILRIEELKPVE